MAAAPWIVPDELWELFEPLLPKNERRFRYPGRKRLPDRQALQGILFVLHTRIAKEVPKRTRARLVEPETGRSTISWSMPPGSRSPGRSRAATATTSHS